MRRLLFSLMALFSLTAHAADVVRVAPWELRSTFWMSLHQTLIAEATKEATLDRSKLSDSEHAAWDAAVASYRTIGGEGDMTFSDPMIVASESLAEDVVPETAVGEALKRAEPIYRAHWWKPDDEANRFFIAFAATMLREGGAQLIREHESVYRATWPKQILAFITPFAGPFGGYTFTSRSGMVITTMSSRDTGYQGFRSLEMLLHESSHAIVYPYRGVVADAISASTKKRSIKVPRGLWHALLFTTSGELTRRFLTGAGVSDYVPVSDEMFTKVWPQFRSPLEKFWVPYLKGEGTLEDAIDKIVGSLP